MQLCYKYFRLLKLLGADRKKGGGKKLGQLKYSNQHCTLTKNAVVCGLQTLK